MPTENNKLKEKVIGNRRSSVKQTRIDISCEGTRDRLKQHELEIRKLRRDQLVMGKRFRTNSILLDENDSGTDTDPEFVLPLSKVKALIEQLSDEDKLVKMEALKMTSKYLVNPSSALRKAILSNKLVPILKNILENGNKDERYQAVWCITNIAAGPKEICLKLIDIIPQLINLISNEERHDSLDAQVCMALGNMASDGPEFRIEMASKGVIKPLVELVSQFDNEVSKNSCFALSCLCKMPNSYANDMMEFDIIPKLAGRLDDEENGEVLGEAYWVLAYLSAELDTVGKVMVQNGLVGTLIKHLPLLYETQDLAIPLIRILGNLASSGDSFTGIMINNHIFLIYLMKYIKSEIRSIKKEALWVLTNLTAGHPANVKFLVNIGVMELMVPLILDGNFDLRKEAGYSILNCLSKGEGHLSYDLILRLTPGFLNFFKSQDIEMVIEAIQFFNIAFKYHQELVNELEESEFTNTLELTLITFNDEITHENIDQLLDNFSDLKEKYINCMN